MKYWLVVFRHPSEKYEFVNWDDNRNSHYFYGKIKNWWQPTSPHLPESSSNGAESPEIRRNLMPQFWFSWSNRWSLIHHPSNTQKVHLIPQDHIINLIRQKLLWMNINDEYWWLWNYSYFHYNDHCNYDEYYGWLWIVVDWIIPPFPTKHQGLEYLIPQIKCWVHPKIRTSHPPKLTGAKCVHHIQIYSYSITFSLRPNVPTKIRTSHPFNGNSRILKWRYCTM